MNICLVSQEYPPETAHGGIGTQNWNKARSLVGLGHTVHVLSCSAHKSYQCRTEDNEGVIMHRMPPPEQDTPINAAPVYWLAYSWSVLRYLRRLMQSVCFDVIDFAEYGAEGFAYQLDRSLSDWVPVAVQLHGPLALLAERIGWPEKDTDFFRVGTFMEGLSIKRADAIMACSANIADFTSAFYGVPREEIDIVHCGVDTASFHPPVDSGRNNRNATVLFVGNITQNKGVHAVLEAVLRLRNKYPGIRLQIAGRAEDDQAEILKRQARQSGAASNVELLGFMGREQVADLYRHADVFCSPAQHESGVANVYIEAMASGCPVIACTTGGAPEAVVDGKTGILVPPMDVEATAAAIERILGNPSLRRRLSLAARRRVDEYFAMNHYIRRVLATYEKAISSSRRKLEHLRPGQE